jgi:tetratricopeptide (TPR) repeat protein
MGPGRWGYFVGWGLVARVLIVAAPVVAQTSPPSQQSQNWAWCKATQDSGVAVDLQIKGCTALIQTKGLSATDLATAHNARAVSYHQNGDSNLAIEDINEAIHLNPKFAKAYYNRGILDREKGDLDMAIADFSDAIRLDPKYLRPLNNRGLAYDAKGDYDHAIADFTEAIRLDPTYVSAFNNRGLAYAAKKDYDHAIADFSEAIRLDPKNSDAFYNRSRAYKTKGEAAHADADYQQVLQLNPKLAAAVPDSPTESVKVQPVHQSSPRPRRHHRARRIVAARYFACRCHQDFLPRQPVSGRTSPRVQLCLCGKHRGWSQAQSQQREFRGWTRGRFVGCEHFSSRRSKRRARPGRHDRVPGRDALKSIHRNAPKSIYHLSIAQGNEAQIVLAAATSEGPRLSSNDKLISVVHAAQKSRSFYFPDSGKFGPLRSVQSAKTLPGEEFAGAALNRLRDLMFAPESYVQVPGLQKSCPFEPAIGFRFAADAGEAWWLVSDYCETGMLVAKADDWRRTSPVNIKREALRVFMRFGGKESSSPSDK